MKKNNHETIKSLLKNKLTIVIIVLALLIVVPAIVNPYFLSINNIKALLRDLAFNGILATGMFYLIVVGDLDLSIGKMGCLCGILVGLMMTELAIPPVLAIIIGLLLGLIFGFLNGIIVTKFRLMAMIVTIGMSSVYSGLNTLLTKGTAVSGLPTDWLFVGQGYVGPIPVPFVIAVVLLVATTFIMLCTRFGRYSFAVGSNIDAANIIGINPDRQRILSFVIMGGFAALTGMLYVARMGTAQPSIGDSWPMNAIAACVIGGVSLNGGEGHPLGAFIGAAIMTLITNVIVMLGVPIYWQTLSSGLVIIIAILIEPVQRMFRELSKKKNRGKVVNV